MAEQNQTALTKKAEKKAKKAAEKARKQNKLEERVMPRVGIIAFAIVAAIVFAATYLRLSAIWPHDQAMGWIWLAVACSVSVLAAMAIFVAYLYYEERELLTKTKQLFTIATLIVIATALTVVMNIIAFSFTAAFLAIILCGVLISRRAAYTMTVIMAGICMLLAVTYFGPGAMDKPIAVALALMVGGIVSVLILNGASGRMQPIVSGTIGGAAAAVTVLGVMAICGASLIDMLVPAAWMLAGCLICGVFATGLLPVFERAFDVATDARLNELMNNNNPLLKRLMLEAPGTYHHSLIVAVMAEAAAELVGANPLLCKTAAYYHDVGKLTSPRYFKENQGEYNIHDDLPPEESARRIIAHQQDSVTMLTKNKFPSEIIKMAEQHHGDSVVAFFYNKARNLAEDPNSVDINAYRYKASRPQTKETAILMLADCCEAAVRSIKRPTSELIEERVHTIVNNLWRSPEGQLSDSPLTAKDVKLIEASFIKNLLAQYHERIEYPATNEHPVTAAQELPEQETVQHSLPEAIPQQELPSHRIREAIQNVQQKVE